MLLSRNVIAALLITVAACMCITTRGINIEQIVHQCSTYTHDQTGDMEKAFDAVALKVIEEAPDQGYNVKEHVSIGSGSYYGNAACNGQLSKDDCAKCLVTAYDLGTRQCLNNDGVTMKLGDCRFRVENYDFDQNE